MPTFCPPFPAPWPFRVWIRRVKGTEGKLEGEGEAAACPHPVRLASFSLQLVQKALEAG